MVISSIFDKSVEIHLPKGRLISQDWPGDNQELLFCIGTITVPIERLKFTGQADAGLFSKHAKYEFFQSIILGMPAEGTQYFLGQQFKRKMEEQLFLRRKLEILRLASEGQQHLDVCGAFGFDGSLRIVDGEHRILALAALGKRRIRIGVVLEK